MLGIRVLHLLRGGERISQYYQGHPLGALPLAGRAMPHTCPCTCRSAPRPRSAIRPVTAPRESNQRRSMGHTQKHKNYIFRMVHTFLENDLRNLNSLRLNELL